MISHLGRRCPMWALFGENLYENERIGSRWGGGGRTPRAPPGSANGLKDFDCHYMQENEDEKELVQCHLIVSYNSLTNSTFQCINYAISYG